MPLPFDATLKDLVRRCPRDFSEGFRLHGPGPPVVMNVDLSLVSAASDVVLAFGDPPHDLVDLNFQSTADDSLVKRLLLYNALLHHRHGVPVHSLLILLRPVADGVRLTGRYRFEGQNRRGRTDFRYEIVRLWQLPARRLLRAGLGMLPLAVLGRLPAGTQTEQGLAGVIQSIQERVVRDATPAEARDLLTASFVLTGLRVNQDAGLRLFQGVRAVEESTTYQAILEKGKAVGFQEMILEQGRLRFGAPDEATQATLTAITNLDRLRRMGTRLLRVDTWQDLLRTR